MRDQKGIAKPPKYAQTGWCWSNSIIFFDQHHPGATRHPSSAEKGTLLFSYRQFIYTVIDLDYSKSPL